MFDFFTPYKQHSLKVIITGEPRSGTSFLCGLISKMGYNLGNPNNIKGADKNNKYGYYEHLKLIRLSNKILKKMGGDFHYNIPIVKENWSDDFESEKKQISKRVNKERIDIYKGNRLLVLSEIYSKLYPDAKWIHIDRDDYEGYKSNFGQFILFEDWLSIKEKRHVCWKNSIAIKGCLNLKYSDFKTDFNKTLFKISSFLEISLTHEQKKDCALFYRPSKNPFL